MKNTGIWIDKSKAIIITIEEGTETLNKVMSNLEKSNIHYVPDNRLKGGIQSSTYTTYENETLKRYFREIVDEVKSTDALVIFGPGETRDQLSKELHTHFKLLGSKIKGVKKEDSMTTNQAKAWVRNFFGTH